MCVFQSNVEIDLGKHQVIFSDVPSGFVYHLEAKAIDGIDVPSIPRIQRRSVDIDINANIEITIDVTKIAATVAAAWLMARWKTLQTGSIPYSRNAAIKIDGHQTRIDNAEIVKRLEQKLDSDDETGNV